MNVKISPFTRIASTSILLLFFAIISIGMGSVYITPLETLQTIFTRSEEMATTIIWDLRIPRVAVAAIVGVNLALSGALLQAVMRNPLADPGLTGVSSGASVTVLAIMLVFPNFTSFVPLQP